VCHRHARDKLYWEQRAWQSHTPYFTIAIWIFTAPNHVFRLPLECWHAGANIGQPETIARAPYGLLASRALA